MGAVDSLQSQIQTLQLQRQKHLHKVELKPHSDGINITGRGHLMGPVLCHSFCNYMGFPAISTALEHPHRLTVLSSYLLGVLLFLLFLFPFTDPSYYGLPTPVCTLTSSPSSLCLS